MNHTIKIDGIYDKRTLKLLKSKNFRHFGFDFSPRSFNFIQEHIFLSDLIPLLDTNDKISLHFDRSNDPMIKKVIEDLGSVGIKKENIYLECEIWPVAPQELGINYYIKFNHEIDIQLLNDRLFAGLIFEFAFFEDLKQKKVINNFVTNFYTRFSTYLADKEVVLKMDWDQNIFPTLFEYFEFDKISLPINSKIEICYRNVDLKKMTDEMVIIEKIIQPTHKF